MRRLTTRWLLAATIAVAAPTVVVPSALACTCGFPTLADYLDDPTHPVFMGTVVADGVGRRAVVVDRWFQGTGEPVVRLAPYRASSCDGLGPPPAGSRWLYAAYAEQPGDPVVVGQYCSWEARLDDPAGADFASQRLAEVTAVFGEGWEPEPIEPNPDGQGISAGPTPVASVGFPENDAPAEAVPVSGASGGSTDPQPNLQPAFIAVVAAAVIIALFGLSARVRRQGKP
jgi:hypothetical protein